MAITSSEVDGTEAGEVRQAGGKTPFHIFTYVPYKGEGCCQNLNQTTDTEKKPSSPPLTYTY